MPERFSTKTVRQGINTFFAPLKRNVFVDNHPDLLFKRAWIVKRHYDATVFLAKVNHMNRKQMLQELLERAVGDSLSEYSSNTAVLKAI